MATRDDTIAKAHELFDVNWPRLRRALGGACRRWGLRREDREDVCQVGALSLWQYSRDAAIRGFRIRLKWPRLAALAWYVRSRRDPAAQARLRSILPDELLDDPIQQLPAPPTEGAIKIDGIQLTAADARLDYPPEILQLCRDGLTASEVANKLGIGRSRVRQLARQLAAIKLDGRWRFPCRLVELRAQQLAVSGGTDHQG